jgi:D-3-phosphoglycerate dehydrogenase
MDGSTRPTIVIPGDDPTQLTGSTHLERLNAVGDVRLFADRPETDAEKISRAADAEVLINTRSIVKWPGSVLEQLPRLRFITVCGIGTDSVDLEAARRMGIVVSNIPGKTAPVVAEHAFGLMLAAAKRAAFQTSEVRAGRWTLMDNIFLGGKTLGVVGTGPIGARMAALGRGLGMRVLAWTFHPSDKRAATLGVEYVELDQLLSESDVVSLHLKLTPDSQDMIGQRELELMKPGALLVNTGRGGLLDTGALIAALESGHLAGAALDVYPTEPISPDDPLLRCDQVILTPHNADQTPEGMDLLNEGVTDNTLAFLDGQPQNVVT